MKPLLIVNPKSGGGRTGELFAKLRGPIDRVLGDSDVVFTTSARHGVELARQAACEGREIVIAVGGDGTIHEVVSGLMQARDAGASSTRLGIIGQGTGGDFRKSLGLEHRLEAYANAIAAGQTKAVDIGRITYARHDDTPDSGFFMNILSVGIGGLVDQYVARASRGLGGTLAYFTASLRALIESQIGHLACTIYDNGQERKEEIATRSLAIANGRFFGSGMQIAPMARLDDGRFDVIDLGAADRVRFARVSSKVYSGAHIEHPDVRHFQCERIAITLLNRDAKDKILLDVDGEPLGRLPLTVALERGAIEVFVP
jgi:YegS/Rv2252/BmrU family lipid kinase